MTKDTPSLRGQAEGKTEFDNILTIRRLLDHAASAFNNLLGRGVYAEISTFGAIPTTTAVCNVKPSIFDDTPDLSGEIVTKSCFPG